MALEEKTYVDKVEVVNAGGDWMTVQVRLKTEILKDGTKISEGYSRTVYPPDTDLSTISDAEVKSVCQLYHTDARKTAYTAYTTRSRE